MDLCCTGCMFRVLHAVHVCCMSCTHITYIHASWVLGTPMLASAPKASLASWQ
jgi:hypothetical protein